MYLARTDERYGTMKDKIARFRLPIGREGSGLFGLFQAKVTLSHMARKRTKTLIYPNRDSVGLSSMLLILYSKFCDATV